MHRAKATKTGYGYVAICEDDDCGWMGDDHPGHDPEAEEAAIEDAAMHSRGERHPWEVGKTVTPWTPSRHPFPPEIWRGGR
jgi:hypothetical protein